MNQDDSTRRRLQEQAAMAHVNQQRAMLDKEEFRAEMSKAIKEALAGISAEAQLDDKVKTLLESADSTISDLLQTVEAKDAELSKFKDRPQDNALTLLARAQAVFVQTLGIDHGHEEDVDTEAMRVWLKDYLKFLAAKKD